jgi:hypothetical protein
MDSGNVVIVEFFWELEDQIVGLVGRHWTEQVMIDLDNGVKVNDGKFGNALQKIVGL